MQTKDALKKYFHLMLLGFKLNPALGCFSFLAIGAGIGYLAGDNIMKVLAIMLSLLVSVLFVQEMKEAGNPTISKVVENLHSMWDSIIK